MSAVAFHSKDARNLLELFPKLENGVPKKIVDVTITSPPYWNLKDYGSSKQIGYDQPYSIYLQDLEKILGDVYRVTKNTGSLWIVVDNFTKTTRDGQLKEYSNGELVPLTYDVIRIAKNRRWKLRDILIWQKDKTLPWSRKGQLRSIFEYVLFFTKTDHYKFYTDRIRLPDQNQLKEWWVKYPERYNPNGISPTNLWFFPIPVQGSWARGYKPHFCPFPPLLVERIVRLTTNKGNMVLDPFAGSGVVMAVAHYMERRSMGLEVNSSYVEEFNSTILEDVGKEMVRIRSSLKRQIAEQRTLRKRIVRLRLTKYPVLLLKKLVAYGPQSKAISTVFAISGRPLKTKGNFKSRFQEDIYLILTSEKHKEALNEFACREMTKPPLSKFGIDAKLRLMTIEEFIEKETKSPSFDHENLWLYAKGVTNMFVESLDFKKWVGLIETGQWIKKLERSLPPLVTDVKIKQRVQATWSSRNDWQKE
jgi:DNA modification methylase